MSTNKNAIIRYNTLDKCFRNTGRKYYFDDLLEKVIEVLQEFESGSVGIKTRQLRDDMRFMKSEAGYAAPIIVVKEGKKAYYPVRQRFQPSSTISLQAPACLYKTPVTTGPYFVAAAC